MGIGQLGARYFWGRYVAHDILPGTYVPQRAADKTAIVNVPDAAGVMHPSVVSTTQVDTVQATADTIVEAAAIPVLAAVTGQPDTEVASAIGTRGNQ